MKLRGKLIKDKRNNIEYFEIDLSSEELYKK